MKSVAYSILAIAYWKMLFGISPNSKPSARFKFFDLWLKFLEERSNQRSITKDTWDLLLEFLTTIKSDFSNYDHDGAWPTWVTKSFFFNIESHRFFSRLIDEFVEFVKTSQAQSSTVHV